MTTEDAYWIVGREGDHRHRMPRHGHATPLSRRDYVRGHLLLRVAKDAVYRAEYEGPEEEDRLAGTKKDTSRCRLLG